VGQQPCPSPLGWSAWMALRPGGSSSVVWPSAEDGQSAGSVNPARGWRQCARPRPGFARCLPREVPPNSENQQGHPRSARNASRWELIIGGLPPTAHRGWSPGWLPAFRRRINLSNWPSGPEKLGGPARICLRHSRRSASELRLRGPGRSQATSCSLGLSRSPEPAAESGW